MLSSIFFLCAAVPKAVPSEKQTVNKVVLAYSGGLDTSVIVRWIRYTIIVLNINN